MALRLSTVATLLVAVALAGCADHAYRSPYADNRFLGDKVTDASYRTRKQFVAAPPVTPGVPVQVTYYSKAFASNDKLALCVGFLTDDGQYSVSLSNGLSKPGSILFIGDPADVATPRVWSGFFMGNNPSWGRIYARCIETATPWDPEYENAAFNLQFDPILLPKPRP
jgi:hypothetical protein